ncbi:simple sugar transport system permease protein [Geosporobacter subterraneus DSM 17957]|uniref:Simple sugar transport system permease protein n=1 Tax=Geosporobacter subterraneus DSM 17957 TaxID=1121919 RepID=A0A1M6G1Y5_9FIRM|nr:ABC transporter permease [Geosporobacter subterraneus]SHJ03904.1 simple sugar transport system permease protein [Geosporobacter subterraneus DSM 17957]
MRDLAFILATTLMYSTPLIYGALGAVFSENSGVVNIGIEGMMTIGAFAGAASTYIMAEGYGHLWWVPWVGFLIGGLAGGLFGLLHAVASVTFQADQTVSGIAINFLAPGLALFLSRRLFENATTTPPIPLDAKLPRPLNQFFDLSSIPGIIFNQYASVYIAFILVFVSWFVLYKTKLGLRIRAVGEHPKAADTLGVNVYRVRYFSVILSGILAGLGGASLSMAIVASFRPTLISGQGFIAMAAMIFGKWKPHGAMLACLLFGATTGIQIYLGSPQVGLQVSANLLSMIPYIITLIVLMGFVGKAVAPAADGIPYEKGDR